MDFAFSEEQEALREAARSFLADRSGSEQVRRAMQSELGFDPGVWKQIAAELGWSALLVPETCGGLGLGWVELVALLEVMGEALLCAPFFSTVCLGANAILAAGSEAQQQEHLPGIAAGQTLATLAVTEADGRWDASGIQCLARRAAGESGESGQSGQSGQSGEWVLRGEKRFVLDGHCADLLVVAARSEASRGETGVSLFLVPAGAPGVERRPLPGMDRTRRLASVALRDVKLPAAALLGEAGGGWPLLSQILDLAAVGLAAEALGGAQRCLDMAVAHARERVQFGRPIGSFQAIQHKCADMFVALESSRSGVYYAGCVAAQGGDELPLLAPLAKASASEAYFRCAAESLQIHGGVGFTWEYDVHLHLKRARSMEAFLGAPAFQRELLARRLGLAGGA